MAAGQLGGAPEGRGLQIGQQRAVTLVCQPIRKQRTSELRLREFVDLHAAQMLASWRQTASRGGENYPESCAFVQNLGRPGRANVPEM